MLRVRSYIALIIISPLLISALISRADNGNAGAILRDGFFALDTVRQDSLDSISNLPYEPSETPTYEPTDRFGDPFSNRTSKSPLSLKDPSSLSLDVEIDTGMNYTIYEKIGDLNFRPTSTMSFEEFNNYHTGQLVKDYWKDRSLGLDGESAVSGRRLIPKLYISPVFDRIFGGDYVDIQPNGFVNLDFGGRWQRNENPEIPIRRQRNGSFNFDQQISMNVVGKVGEKLSVTANFDNNNTFDFQNDMKVEYTGFEEDIIKKIEIGNVSMPVNNSLMTGAQSLFGVKTKLQFGKLFLTGVASRQQGTIQNDRFNPCETVPSSGGSQLNSGALNAGQESNYPNLSAWDYAENQHFFLGYFFREKYEEWVGNYPLINNGGLSIDGRVEVWQLTIGNNDTRSLREVLALTDLGESKVLNRPNVPEVISSAPTDPLSIPTDNKANDLFQNLVNTTGTRDINEAASILRSWGLEEGIDYIRTQARKLDQDEYYINPTSGFLSLRTSVNPNQMVAVAYQYTYNGVVHTVGEVSQNIQRIPDDQNIFLKLIKPNTAEPSHPTWDLQMKNIYRLGGSNISNVNMQIQYWDFGAGLPNPSIPEGINTANRNLLRLLGLDRLNQNEDNQPDGNFDDIPGITIYQGHLVFPILEPFGDNFRALFGENEDDLIKKYVFDEIYDETQQRASLVAEKDYFKLKVTEMSGDSGGAGSSGNSRRNQEKTNRFPLRGFNIPESSIVATMGSRTLQPGVDYRVDFNAFVIINDQILNSCQTIEISYEETDLFNFQTKWLTGARAEYIFNENFNIGGTILRLNERPGGISRFSIGSEPLNNTKYGFDINYSGESRFLTKMVDALPFVSTKEKSTINFSAEFAQLIPGTSNQVNGESTSYIDDFENAITPINLGSHLGWKLGSTPQTNGDKFFNPAILDNAGADPQTIRSANFKRAKIAWYSVDNSVFYRNGGVNAPANLSDMDFDNIYQRPYIPQEIFTQRDRNAFVTNEQLFDIVYFPNERGPYNYSTDLSINPLTGQAELSNPASNFGALSRGNNNISNFEINNMEYIEFWLLDPFADEIILPGRTIPKASGGKLVFNFGSISEDVLKDDRHSFEHGLPGDGSDGEVTTNAWGRITDKTYLNDFFSNSPDDRINQDLGLDGANNTQEQEIFADYLDQLSPDVRALVENDPSGDDFHYYLGDDLDQNSAEIIERYKDFNNPENNSPVGASNGNFVPAYSNQPDKEDLLGDNGVSTTETYFEYEINLREENLRVGEEFIVDRVEVPGTKATWYLFRIPLSRPTRKYGPIQDRQNVQYYRMYLTGFTTPVVLRMTNFQLVGSQWRKNELLLAEPGFQEIPDPSQSDFDISVVSIEENGELVEGKVPYVVPPGLTRDQDNTTTIQRRNNEQSLRVCVNDLQDQDARAVFKQGLELNLQNYGRLKMFLHAEEQDEMVEDGDVAAFVRLGADRTGNYYEIELPLRITDKNNLPNNEDALKRAVWPEENEIDLSFNELYALKGLRNQLSQSTTQEFSRQSSDGKYKLTVFGDPKLSNIKTIMIGVRNPKSDDGAPKSVCIWANEMRVTDFDTKRGWAAKATFNTKLADFATFSASGSYISSGFGGIQQNISERTQTDTRSISLNTSVQADQLLPGKHGIKIPVSMSYGNRMSVPRFDPTDSDIPLEAALLNYGSDEEEEEFRQIVEEKETTRSINISNFRKEKVKEDAVPHIYDIENLSFDWAYSEVVRSGTSEAEFFNKRINYGAAYQYQFAELYVEPFKESEALSSPYFQLIKDLNFNPLPNNISVRADLNRNFQKTRNRNPIDYSPLDSAIYIKTFYFDRNYAVKWNLFRSLSLDYTARANAIIDEPDGEITEHVRDSIFLGLKEFGRLKTFDQSMSANYTLPFDKFPVTDWINSTARYTARYNWTAGTRQQVDQVGNTLQNSRQIGLTTGADLVGLYNKVEYFKRVNTPSRGVRRRPSKEDTVQRNDNKVIKGLARLLMSVRNVKMSYQLTESTILPGVTMKPFLFGLDSGFHAPGVPFILGSQDPDIRFNAVRNEWLIRSAYLNNPFTQNRTEDITGQASIEPFSDLKIQLDVSRKATGQYTEVFKFLSDSLGGDNEFESITPSRGGSYSITFNTIRTAFESKGRNSEVFATFEENIDIVRNRLNNERLNPGDSLYDGISQDVLIPAFLAAYNGSDMNSAKLNPFPKIPLPNWRLDYAGLTKIPALQSMFSAINITHAYRSVYNVSNYVSNFSFSNDNTLGDALSLENRITDYPFSRFNSETGTREPVYVVNQITITEQFAPFIGINIRTNNKMNIKIDYKKERNLSLNLSNRQVTEEKRNNVTVDFGITKSSYTIPFRIRGRKVTLENDLTFRTAIGITDNRVFQRKIGEGSEITNGDMNVRIRPTLDYKYNKRLNVTAYFERTLSNPRVGNFPRRTTAFGFQIRFSLAQ